MRVLVAGGSGMIGRNVARLLTEQGHRVIRADIQHGVDLRESDICELFCRDKDAVFHLADRTVGIGYSSKHHGEMLTNSLLVSLNLLEAARKSEVKNYLYVSSSCVYPDIYGGKVIENEANENLSPEPANEGYGWAKRVGEIQARYYAKEYGMKTVIVRPSNIYGPSYDWTRDVEDAHVIPALIRKMLRKDPEIQVWGTGHQTRTFQHERDTARLMIDLLEKGESGEAYNLGGFEVSIKNLAYMLAGMTEFDGEVVFDPSKPCGPIKKAQNTRKTQQCLGISECDIANGNISISDGLYETIQSAKKVIS